MTAHAATLRRFRRAGAPKPDTPANLELQKRAHQTLAGALQMLGFAAKAKLEERDQARHLHPTIFVDLSAIDSERLPPQRELLTQTWIFEGWKRTNLPSDAVYELIELLHPASRAVIALIVKLRRP